MILPLIIYSNLMHIKITKLDCYCYTVKYTNSRHFFKRFGPLYEVTQGIIVITTIFDRYIRNRYTRVRYMRFTCTNIIAITIYDDASVYGLRL